MNATKKISVELALGDIAMLKGVANALEKPYHDKKVSDFAKNAVSEYKEIESYIAAMICENKELFFDFDNFRINNGGFGDIFCPNENILAYIGKYLTILVRLDRAGVIKSWKGNAGGLYTKVNPQYISIVGVRAYTTNTSDPNYNALCASSLTGGGGAESFFLSGIYDAKTWQAIYHYAKSTRRKAELLWKAFEESLEVLKEKYKGRAEAAERNHIKNAEIGGYVKVSRIA